MNKKLTGLKTGVVIRFAAIFVLLLMLLFSSTSSISSVRATKDLTADLNSQIDSLNGALAGHHEWGKNLIGSIALGTNFTGATDPNACSLGTFINGSSVVGSSYYSEFLTAVVSVHERLHANGVTVVGYGPDNYDAALALYESQILPDIALVVTAIKDQEVRLSALLDELDNQLETEITFASLIILLCTVLIIVLVSSTYYYLRSKVVAPLQQIAEETQKLSLGDLNLSFDKTSDVAEIYSLSNALTISVSELDRMISEIDGNLRAVAKKDYTVYPSMTFPGAFKRIESSIANMIDGIRKTFTDIGVTTSQVQTACEQFIISSRHLADGSTEQAASVEELSATVNNMTTNMDESVQDARNANKLGKNAAEMMTLSSTEMNDLMKAMKEIEESTAAVNNIIKTINDIASQTNILALNAAVEAARAGESGKGFAVVADEVRNLAQKSAEAVKNTTQLIEHCLEVVNSGADLASHTNDSFTEMQGNVTEVIDLITKVASNLEEQNDSLSNFSIGMDQISAVVQTNTATSEQTASTSEELNLQVVSLNGLINEFKVKQPGMGR